MSNVEYDFGISAFVSLTGSLPALDGLTHVIQVSSIVTALDYISYGSPFPLTASFFFKAALSGGDQTSLNTIVAQHNGQHYLSGTGTQIVGTDATGTPPTVNPVLIGSFDGTNVRTVRSDTFGNSIVTDLPYAMAFGLMSGSNAGRVAGYIGTSATSGKAIRAMAYAAQGTNAQRSLKSTNVNDNVSGSGAQTVTINYLNTSFQLKTDTVWLSGTLPARTNATDIAFIENMVVNRVGVDGGNDGTINIYTDTAGAGSIWGSIAAQDNMTFWAHHYVPAGVTCYLIAMTCGATVAAGQTNLNHSGNPLSTNVPQLQMGPTLVHVAAGTWDHDFGVPLAVPGPDLIWLVERPIVATASTALAGFEFIQF